MDMSAWSLRGFFFLFHEVRINPLSISIDRTSLFQILGVSGGNFDIL